MRKLNAPLEPREGQTYTKEQIQEKKELDELAAKLKSQRWRLNNLYRITSAQGDDIPFRMNYAQKLLYIGMWFCNVILKSRQHGITTFICLLYLDICLFNSNMHACIIAHNKEDAANFFAKKILNAYNKLPELIRAQIPATRSSSQELVFSNGSSIRVTTSGRSGTYQMVHISEFGKMCAKYPLKAEEVISGTLNSVHEGMLVTVESTAEGQEGAFYEMVKRAQAASLDGRELGKLEFKYFFFGWHDNALNETDQAEEVMPTRVKDYLDGIEKRLNIQLTQRQRSWYSQKEASQGELMLREHPSTAEEAFRTSMEGTYYTRQFNSLRAKGQVTSVPFQPSLLVSTWWDLGFNDQNAIWFSQDIGREIHLIHYYENSGESLMHYKEYLDEMAKSRGYKYAFHMAPHDIMVHEYTTGKTRIEAAAGMGIKFQIGNKTGELTQVERVRAILPICWFDRDECDAGIRALESFRKQWNPRIGAYSDNPFHDWSSHGASAFAQIAVMHPFSGAATIFSGAATFSSTGPIGSVPDPRGWT